MAQNTIEQWEHTQAELAIRRWLVSIGQWAPGAEFAHPPEDTTIPGALSDEQVDAVLRSEVVGRIGCHADGKTYVVPVVYAYDGSAIYGHSNEGLKMRMLRANSAVCFEVDHVERLSNWQSVIVWGQFEELHGEDADRAEQLLVERLKPVLADQIEQLSQPPAPAGRSDADLLVRRAVVYRISVTERTGRYMPR
jgi:nitroimidazol reductase NimA-like FMN-containing flavoprotein (pyridoxamine 5'-phosphate oxidase superfamily)